MAGNGYFKLGFRREFILHFDVDRKFHPNLERIIRKCGSVLVLIRFLIIIVESIRINI